MLYRIADAIEARLDELAELESRDTGKPVALARAMDIPRAVANFRFFAGAILHESTQCTHMADAVNYTHRTPVGVVGLITPWNLPLYLLTWKVAPALAMGNTIVAKPSEITPMTANALAEIVHEVGLPAGVLNLVHGLGGEAGQAVVAHEDIAAISFTGGTATGRIVARTAAPMFKKLSLELGGKNATVVFADCDFEEAVKVGVRASFANQGQVCLCGSRVLVERSIFDKYLEAFLAETAKLQPGDPRTSNFGSLSSLAHREKVEGYVQLARESGATIHCGGRRPDLPAPFSEGAFYEPTVITGVDSQHACFQEEIFGPVVVLLPFDDEAEALELANGTQFGLAGSVWTSNLRRGHRFAAAVQSGMIWVNCWLHRDLRVPFGGVKNSGVGREGGPLSLEFFSETKNICVKLEY